MDILTDRAKEDLKNDFKTIVQKGIDIKIKGDTSTAAVLVGASEGILSVGEGVYDATLALKTDIVYYPLAKVVDKVKGTNKADKVSSLLHGYIKEDITDQTYDKLYETEFGKTIEENSIDLLKRNGGGDDASLGYKGSKLAGQIGFDAGLTAIPIAGPYVAATIAGLSGAGNNIEDTLNEMDEEELNNTTDLMLADAKGVAIGTIEGLASYAIKGAKGVKGAAKAVSGASTVETAAVSEAESIATSTGKKGIKEIIKSTLASDKAKKQALNKLIKNMKKIQEGAIEKAYTAENTIEDIAKGKSDNEFLNALIDCDDFNEFTNMVKDKSEEEIKAIASQMIDKLESNETVVEKEDQIKNKLEYLQTQIERGQAVSEDIEDTYQAIMDSINNNVQAIQTR